MKNIIEWISQWRLITKSEIEDINYKIAKDEAYIDELNEDLNDLNRAFIELEGDYLVKEEQVINLQAEVNDNLLEINRLEDKLQTTEQTLQRLLNNNIVNIESLQSYYEGKRRQQAWRYNGVRLGRADVRIYLQPSDLTPFTNWAKRFVKNHKLKATMKPQDIISKIYEHWIYIPWTYVTDKQQFGSYEYWEDPTKSFLSKRDDCFTGDTKIIVKDIRDNQIKNISFDDLKKEWVYYHALSYDLKKKKSVFKPITDFIYKGVKPVYEVKPKRGSSFKCTNNHRILMSKNKSLRWTELKDFDISKFYTRRACAVIGMPEYGETLSDEMCNLIGSYVADGWTQQGKNCIAGDNEDRQNKLAMALTKLGYTYSFSKRKVHAYINIHKHKDDEMRTIFDEMGCKGTYKQFPDWVMSLDNESIKRILFYYGERDGTHHDGKLAIFSTVSNKLAEQLKLLLTKLGVHHSCYLQHQDNRTDCKRQPCYRINIEGKGIGLENNLEANAIMDYKYIGEEEVYDITIADTHNFVLADNNIVVHNCEGKAKAMYWTFICVLRELGLESHEWRLTFVASMIVGAGGHAYLTWLADNGEYYAIESTYDERRSYQMTWLKTPIRFNNMYGSFWGFATYYKSWVGGNTDVLDRFEEGK